MALHASPAICERARSWASLRLDGELSEFEDALLSAHLAPLRPVQRVRAQSSAAPSRHLRRGAAGAADPPGRRSLPAPCAAPPDGARQSRRRRRRGGRGRDRADLAVRGAVPGHARPAGRAFGQRRPPAGTRHAHRATRRSPRTGTQLGVRGAVLQRRACNGTPPGSLAGSDPVAPHLALLSVRPRGPCGDAREGIEPDPEGGSEASELRLDSGRSPARRHAGSGVSSCNRLFRSPMANEQNVGKVVEVKGVVIDVVFPGTLPADQPRARDHRSRRRRRIRGRPDRRGPAASRATTACARSRWTRPTACRAASTSSTPARRSASPSARRRSAGSGTCSASRSTAARRPRRERWPIHRDPPAFRDLSPKAEIFETGIKVDRPDRARSSAAARSASSAAPASARRC